MVIRRSNKKTIFPKLKKLEKKKIRVTVTKNIKKNKDINPKHIDVDFIKNNTHVWIPPNIEEEYTYPTDSWFNIKATNFQTKQKGKDVNIYSSEIRSKRIEIYPTSEQRNYLLRWFEVYRRLYNLTIQNKSKLMKKNGDMLSFRYIREKIMKHDIVPKNKRLSKEIENSMIPAHTLWNAISDVCKAFKSAMANKNAKNIKRFRLRYKKLSNHTRTLVLEPSAFSKKLNAFAVKVLGHMNSSESFGNVNHECRLSYNYRTDKFILWKPCDKVNDKIYYRNDIISLDPGVRTFQNGYSPNGICYKFSPYQDKIKNIMEKIENVRKDLIKRNGKRKRHKKYTDRLYEKMTNMVTDLHWKLANFLCKRFNKILLGKMSTTGIVKKESSVLTSKTKQLCIQLSHYKFRERLLSKAAEYNVVCDVVDESYTTKTCGQCGIINNNVGSSKIFKCISNTCSVVIDRDYNAARNIYLKTLSKKI